MLYDCLKFDIINAPIATGIKTLPGDLDNHRHVFRGNGFFAFRR